MALIEIDLPDGEEWQESLTARLLLLLLAGALVRAGFQYWVVIDDPTPLTALPAVIPIGLAALLMLLIPTDVDLSEHGRTIAVGTAVLMTGLLIAVVFITGNGWLHRLNTDGLAFSRVSLDLLSQGVNPYGASMEPAAELRDSGKWWTYRTDGTRVWSLSYPAGAVLWYLPQYLTVGVEPFGIRLTSILVTGALCATMALSLPGRLALAAPVTMLLPRKLWAVSAGGITDMLWALPVAAAIVAWAADRRVAAAALLGVAAGTKQQAWVILPYIAIWVWKERESVREFASNTVRYSAAGLGTFLALNGPFILWNPGAWLSAVFTPLGSDGAPLVMQGVGLVMLTVAGAPIPRAVYTYAVLATVVVTLVAYWRWFDRVKWSAWVVPPTVFFFHSRSLASYFSWYLPLCLLALAAVHGRLRWQSPTPHRETDAASREGRRAGGEPNPNPGP